MIGTGFGIGTPIPPSMPQLSPWSAGFGSPGGGFSPGQWPQYAQPLTSFPIGSPAAHNPIATQVLPQVLHLLQVVPTQLHQLQQLEYAQQQQLQQLLHVIPAQLAQLQQSIQFASQQIQQLPQAFQSQPFGQAPGNTGYGVSTLWGVAPPAIGAPSTQVM